MLNTATTSLVLQTIIDNFPKSHYSARKFLNIDRDNFDKYVVCRKCESLYKYDKCVLKKYNGTMVSKTCSYV